LALEAVSGQIGQGGLLGVTNPTTDCLYLQRKSHAISLSFPKETLVKH